MYNKSPYWQLFESPVYASFACFVAFGISQGIGSNQDGGDRFWVHFGTLERTQVFTGICGIRFTVIQINTSNNSEHGFKKAKALVLRCR